MSRFTFVPGFLLAMPLALTSGVTFADECASPFAAAAPAMLLAGEIILAPPSRTGSISEGDATRMKEAARDQRRGNPPSSVIIVDEAEEGVLSPRRGPSSPADNSARARNHRLDGDSSEGALPSIIIGPLPSGASPAPSDSVAAQKAHSNRVRAIEYRKGDQSAPVSARGGEGLPVVDCTNVENVAGRIGDDNKSGSLIILIQDRNQVKARCR